MNNSLKTFYLKISGTKTVSSLVEFIPEQLLSYAKLNYMYSSEHKVYSANVPEFLWDRPRTFVQHCLKNLEAACCYTSQQVQEQSKGLYKVQSEQSCEWYSVDLGDKDRFPSWDQSGVLKENLLTDFAAIDLPETETLLAELSKHEIEVDSGVRLSICGQVLESSDFESLKHPHWLNDKVINAYLDTLTLENNIEANTGYRCFNISTYMPVLWERDRFDAWMFEKEEIKPQITLTEKC
ncbi:unnamed protein product [Leuciscus chuanchicus]